MDTGDKSDWINHEHTGALRASAEAEVSRRFATLMTACKSSTDPKVVAAYSGYAATRAVAYVLRRGDLTAVDTVKEG